jgi:hypothetical protein
MQVRDHKPGRFSGAARRGARRILALAQGSGEAWVMAERTFRFEPSVGSARPVVVRVGVPVGVEDGEGRHEWSCAIEVVGLGRAVRRHVYGVDGIQALLLALGVLDAHVRRLAIIRKGRLTWLGSEDLGLDAPHVCGQRREPNAGA